MRKILSVLTIIGLLAVLLAGCAGTFAFDEITAVPVTVNQEEDALYQDIFFNGKADANAGVKVTKTGTFAKIYDVFSEKERYYVWGYRDDEKSRDWQWEICFDENAEIPASGAAVTVSGEFAQDDAALDHYWIVHPQVEVKETYPSVAADVDLLTMDETLQRVMLQGIQLNKDFFEGKTVLLYGKCSGEHLLASPYQSELWSMHIHSEKDVPADGTMVLVFGTIKNGVIENAQISETTLF